MHGPYFLVSEESEEMSRNYILRILKINEYETIKDGGEYPKYDCPECGSYSFVCNNEKDIWRCFECGYEESTENIGFCQECGQPYRIDDEEDLGLCADCFQYKFEKD